MEAKVYAKGEEIKYINREGEEALYPNAQGQHLVRVQGKGLTYLSRKEARRKSRSHPATKKNFEYQSEKMGFKHIIGKKEVPKRRDPKITNHTAHRERQLLRLAKEK